MAGNGNAGKVQLVGKGIPGTSVHALKLIQHKSQILQSDRGSKSQRLFISTPRVVEMAADKRCDETPVRKFRCRRLVCMVHRSDDEATTGEVFKQEGVIGVCPSVAVREDDHGMAATRHWSVETAVGPDSRQGNSQQMREVAPRSGRSVVCRFASLL